MYLYPIENGYKYILLYMFLAFVLISLYIDTKIMN